MERACEGKVALVTGASRGIGAAIAQRLASEGAKVAISARTLEPDPKYVGSLQETAEEIVKAGGTAVALKADLSKPEDRDQLVADTVEALGPVDILVNNAAVTFLLPFGQITPKRYDLMFEVQVKAPFQMTQAVWGSMVERGGGHILNISSRAGIHAIGPPFMKLFEDGGFTVYGMVKAALNRFTSALAAEGYQHRIAVNSLSPWDNVATPGAGAHELVDGFALEDVSFMTEAALALVTGPPELTGRVAFSQPLLAELGLRPPPTVPGGP
jgi:citronellol/citronellal dehydrogenase